MDQLPNEILIRILQYLNTYDLVQFCSVFKSLDYFLQEKDVIKCSDWSNKFEMQDMNLCKFISTKMNPDYIKILKINSIYWIPSQDLRRLLSKLPALEELHAIDTKLGLRSNDIVEYFKLKKLAVSVEDDHFEYETVMESKHLKLLKYLYLKIIFKKEDHREIDSGLRLFFCNLDHLEELWIQDDHESLYRINYERLVVQMEKLLKFVLRSKSVLPMYDFRFVGLSKTFECKRCNTEGELIFTKVLDRRPSKKSLLEPKETALEKAWDVFEGLHADLPCGPKESELLNKREELKDIQFEELNFCHAILLCNPQYVDAALQILETKNCRGLKKLNFRSCLFQMAEVKYVPVRKKRYHVLVLVNVWLKNHTRTNLIPKHSAPETEEIMDEHSDNFQHIQKQEINRTSFKKARVGVKMSVDNHPFEKIAKHLKNLVELEILTCPGCNGGGVVTAYPLITNFEKLKRLNLEIPILLDGSFLKQVFQTCQHLEYLNLTITSINEIFLQNLYQYLGCAVSLKHFRLVCPRVNLEKLFSSFCQMPSRKLLRLFIKCDNIIYSTTTNEEELFSSFFETHPQLLFFYLVINQSTRKQISNIQKIINEYKKGQPAKVFYCKKDIDPFIGVFPIPSAHRDFIFNRTRVSVIDFDSFS